MSVTLEVLECVYKLTDNIKVVKLVYRLSQLSKHLLFDQNSVQSFVNCFVIEGLYVTQVGFHQMEVSLLREEAHSTVVVQS